MKLNTLELEKIWLSSPHMGGKEQEYVKDAFETNWIAPLGPNVDGFEQDIASCLKENVHVAALSSGTAALHLALIILGVKQGDEVLCQSMTFSASANPIIYQGATPIFIDSDPDSWNISPTFLRIAIEDRLKKGKKPKAIIPVHLYGMPCNLQEIISISNEYEIPVIEDAAESLGSTYHGRATGTFGDMSILSFNGNKIITTSGGGALVSSNVSRIKKARFLATQARDTAPHYEHSEIGYNYRMSNVCAGIGRGQMLVLTERVKKRRQIFENYKAVLKNYPGVSFQIESPGMYSNRWLTSIILDPALTSNGISNQELRTSLEVNNIESRPLWKPMHLQPVFKDAPFYGDGISESLFKKGLCLPSGSNMNTEDFERIIEKIIFLFK
jgi:dTDP-4-amino-4,6-dideoxygalactose transaminase